MIDRQTDSDRQIDVRQKHNILIKEQTCVSPRPKKIRLPKIRSESAHPKNSADLSLQADGFAVRTSMVSDAAAAALGKTHIGKT